MNDTYRSMLRSVGHIPMKPTEIIRKRCLECKAYVEHAVNVCDNRGCIAWPWRKGTDPWRKTPDITDAEREARRERMAKAREKRWSK